jgi:predicted DNA-binding transcriptional regulator AlpA
MTVRVMEYPSMSQSNRLPTVQVAKRFGVSLRTIERWLDSETLNFPRPITINRRRYWVEAEIAAWEIERRRQQEDERTEAAKKAA